MATLLAALALAGASSHPHVLPYGTQATWHSHHGIFASGITDDRSGWSYHFPVKVPARVVRHHVRHSARHVQRRRRGSAAIRAPRGRYTASMLVTWYGATGSPMANGIYPSIGWAACGYEIRLGARVSVPGIGLLTCGDRMCNTCPGIPYIRHIDVFGIPLGTGHRNVTVY